MIFFTADLHFGHTKIITYCNRPFVSASHMDTVLISNWNTTVTSEDEVYILGDLTLRPPVEAHEYLSRLVGRKYFIRGNHDKFLKGFQPYESDFVWVKDYHVLRHAKQRLVLSHYPMLEWESMYRGAIHLYGHVHNNEESIERLRVMGERAFNVGVDVNDFRPVSIDEILKRVEGRTT